jgi:hypothetical protein
MLDVAGLKLMAEERIKDADILHQNNRIQSSVYICGYAVEIALKYAICKSLNWSGFPSTKKEFEGLVSFKTHELERLIKLSGIEKKIKKNLLSDWSIVKDWNPEQRYSSIKVTADDAADMIDSSRKILGEIWKI